MTHATRETHRTPVQAMYASHNSMQQHIQNVTHSNSKCHTPRNAALCAHSWPANPPSSSALQLESHSPSADRHQAFEVSHFCPHLAFIQQCLHCVVRLFARLVPVHGDHVQVGIIHPAQHRRKSEGTTISAHVGAIHAESGLLLLLLLVVVRRPCCTLGISAAVCAG